MKALQTKASTPKTLLHVMIYFLLFLAGDLLSSIAFDFLFSMVKLPYRELYVIPRMSGCLLLTLLFFWLYTTKALHLDMRAFGITLEIKSWGVLCAVLLPAFVVCVYLAVGDAAVNMFAPSDGAMIAAASIITALKAGVLEEMLFRGFIMKLLEHRWNRWVAILAPSFLFSLVHIPSMEAFSASGVLLLVVSGTLVGIMFSLVTYKGKSVSNSALMHTLWNFVLITDIFHITTVQGAYGEPFFPVTIASDNRLLTGGEFGVEASLVAVVGYLLVCGFVIWGRRTEPRRPA